MNVTLVALVCALCASAFCVGVLAARAIGARAAREGDAVKRLGEGHLRASGATDGPFRSPSWPGASASLTVEATAPTVEPTSVDGYFGVSLKVRVLPDTAWSDSYLLVRATPESVGDEASKAVRAHLDAVASAAIATERLRAERQR